VNVTSEAAATAKNAEETSISLPNLPDTSYIFQIWWLALFLHYRDPLTQ
jgi:hypothetical protein